MKHTKGPWQITGDEITYNQGKNFIASMYILNEDETLANAKLIAAGYIGSAYASQ